MAGYQFTPNGTIGLPAFTLVKEGSPEWQAGQTDTSQSYEAWLTEYRARNPQDNFPAIVESSRILFDGTTARL